MTTTNQSLYEFGPFRADPAKRLLLRGGEVVPLTPKAFDLLLALVEMPGEVVEKDKLIERVWPDSFVEEGNLTYNISVLRKTLGERASDHQYIVTVPGRGYQFVATVTELGPRDQKSEPHMGSRTDVVTELKPAPDKDFVLDTFKNEAAIQPSNAERLAHAVKRNKTVFAAIIVLGAIASFLLSNRGNEPETYERTLIAVVDFVNETDEQDLNGLSGMLTTSLEQSRRLSVLTRSHLFDILKQMGKGSTEHVDETLGKEICNRAGVSALVIASVRKFDQLYAIDLKVLDPQKNQYIFAAKEEAHGKASIPGMIDRLSEKTRAGLRERTAEIQAANQKIADVTTTNLEAYRHYFLGEQLYNKYKNDEAATEFEKAIALDPSFALAHYQLAYMLGWSNPNLAREPIQKAMTLIDRVPEKERYMVRAVSAYAEGNARDAIDISKEALKSYPSNKEALWMVGDLSFHTGDYATGITFIERVLELDPQFEPARGHLLWAFKEAGAYDKMLQYARRYVEEMPTEEVYLLLVEAHVLRRDFDGGAHANKGFEEAFPKSWMPIWVAGQRYLLENQYERAAAESRRLVEGSRPPEERGEGYRLLADSFAYQGKYRDAINAIDAAIATAFKEGDARDLAFNYAKRAYCLLVGHRDAERARNAIDQALELNSGSALVYQLLFYCHLLLGEYGEASAIANRHLGALGPFGDVMVSGWRHRARGEYEAAITGFQLLVERGFSVDRIVCGYELARCFLETGQFDKAIDEVSKMQALCAFGMRANQYRAAAYPRGFYLLGRIYENKQDKRLARKSYQKFLELWKLADRDVPELIEAKSRLASLKGV